MANKTVQSTVFEEKKNEFKELFKSLLISGEIEISVWREDDECSGGGTNVAVSIDGEDVYTEYFSD